MANHPRAGQLAQQSDLINVAQLVSQYYVLTPEAGNTSHAVNSALQVTVEVPSAIVSMKHTF